MDVWFTPLLIKSIELRTCVTISITFDKTLVMDLANSADLFYRCSNIDGQKPTISNLTNPQLFLLGVFLGQFITDGVVLPGFM